MEDEIHDMKTLDCAQSEEIPAMEETPLPETVKMEIPPSDFLQCDETLDESSRIEVAQLPEINEDRGKIEDVHLSKTLREASKSEIEAAHVPKIADKSSSRDVESSEDQDGSSSAKDYSEFDPIAVFADCNDGTEPCVAAAGLSNLGNTCFLNAILQCFTHTVPLVQGLQSLKHDSSSHGTDEFCGLCAVRDQIEHAFAYSGRVISPSNLVDNLSQICCYFRRYQQEDAHEFLQCLLDKLDNSWSKYEVKSKDSSVPGDSLVKQVFGGRLVSQVHCSKCGHNSDTYEPLVDLSLEIEDVDNLQSALKSFTKVESIEDKLTCESCKEQVRVEKQLMLDEAPSVAAFQLKRFKSDGLHVEKIDKAVDYPLELDMEPYTKGVKDENVGLKYDLFAIVVHVGFSSTSGHYFCYIRTSLDVWYRFDDSKVTRVSEATALSQDAYILFYARKGTPWFSSLIEKWKECSDRKIFNASPKSVLDNMDLPSTSYHHRPSLHGCEEVETSSNARGASAELSSGLRYNEVELTAGVDSKSPSAPNYNELKVDEAKLDAQVSAEAKGSYIHSSTELQYAEDETGKVGDTKCSPSHMENILHGEAKDDLYINPSTPPRSQSPDIYSDEELAEVRYQYHIPVDHLRLKVEEKAGGSSSSSKKLVVDKAKHDVKRKEAAKYMCKSMPSSRRHLLMAAMMGPPRSDTSLNKKRRKQASFSHDTQSPNSNKQIKLTPKRPRPLRPVAA